MRRGRKLRVEWAAEDKVTRPIHEKADHLAQARGKKGGLASSLDAVRTAPDRTASRCPTFGQPVDGQEAGIAAITVRHPHFPVERRCAHCR